MSTSLARVQRLMINEMPPHNLFLELYTGRKPILALKRRALVNIGVDSDPESVQRANQQLIDSGISVLQDDALSFLQRNEWLHPEGGELIVCKPPVLDLRRRDATEGYQELLLQTLRDLPCLIMIAGTWSELYDRLLAGWRSIPYRGADGVEEFLWLNFPQPYELHDYKFLGNNAHERDQLKRMADRWSQRLDDLPPLKRYALLSALNERGSRLGKQ